MRMIGLGGPFLERDQRLIAKAGFHRDGALVRSERDLLVNKIVVEADGGSVTARVAITKCPVSATSGRRDFTF